MSSRRQFLSRTVMVAAGLGVGSVPVIRASEPKQRRTKDRERVKITSVIRRDETTVHHGGSGDNWHMSWAADGRQVLSMCDGYGWFDKPKGMYNSRLLSISGGPQDAKFKDLPGYPELIPEMGETRYYNFGTLAVDGRIYQFLSTLNHPALHVDGTLWPDMRFIGAKLIYSPDDGRTWCNHDGTTPVYWPTAEQQSRRTLTFFQEEQDAFSLLSIAQMGRNYGTNKDGYIYVYSPNGNTEGTMNQLVMFRVPKAQLLNRSAYEYFGGLGPDGNAVWVRDLRARGVVHTFPRGWVNTIDHPWAWMPSVVYNEPLDVFLMTSWGTSSASDGTWFDKASYFGFWKARNPWGPWTQIHEETAWTPVGDTSARAFAPQISPKWISEDGRSLWIVWSDYQKNESECKRMSEISLYRRGEESDLARRRADQLRRCRPMYSFHTQRVDLIGI